MRMDGNQFHLPKGSQLPRLNVITTEVYEGVVVWSGQDSSSGGGDNRF